MARKTAQFPLRQLVSFVGVLEPSTDCERQGSDFRMVLLKSIIALDYPKSLPSLLSMNALRNSKVVAYLSQEVPIVIPSPSCRSFTSTPLTIVFMIVLLSLYRMSYSEKHCSISVSNRSHPITFQQVQTLVLLSQVAMLRCIHSDPAFEDGGGLMGSACIGSLVYQPCTRQGSSGPLRIVHVYGR
jgi:hypothetical protein